MRDPLIMPLHRNFLDSGGGEGGDSGEER